MVERPRAPAPALSIVAIGASRLGLADRAAVGAPVERIDPADLAKEPDDLAESEQRADHQHAEDQPVEPGIGAEGERDLLIEMSATKPTSARNAAMPTRKMRGEVRRRISESVAMDRRAGVFTGQGGYPSMTRIASLKARALRPRPTGRFKASSPAPAARCRSD